MPLVFPHLKSVSLSKLVNQEHILDSQLLIPFLILFPQLLFRVRDLYSRKRQLYSNLCRKLSEPFRAFFSRLRKTWRISLCLQRKFSTSLRFCKEWLDSFFLCQLSWRNNTETMKAEELIRMKDSQEWNHVFSHLEANSFQTPSNSWRSMLPLGTSLTPLLLLLLR